MILKHIQKSFTKHLSTVCASENKIKSIDEMPIPFKLPIIGSLYNIFGYGLKTKFHKYIDKQHSKLGLIFLEKVGPVNAVFTKDPDSFRDLFLKFEGKYPQHILPQAWMIYNKKHNCERGLLFMDGDDWLQLRRKINNLILKPGTELWINKPISRIIDNMILKWRQLAINGFQPNLEKELYAISLQVMLSIMLGDKYENSKEKFTCLIEEFSTEVQKIFVYSTRLHFFSADLYAKLNHPTWKSLENSITKSLDYVEASNRDQNTYYSFVVGKRVIDEMLALENKGDGLLTKMIEENLTNEEILKVLVDFIIAAGDTTTFTTEWTLYLLAKNRICTMHIRKDISNGDLTSSKNAIKESMRLYPVAAFVTRILPEPAILLDYELPAGTVVSASLYSSGRDPNYFTEPLIFRPNRWNRDSKINSDYKTSSHASLPFAIGARSCVGKKIAMEQMTQIVSKIVQNFQMTLLNKKPVKDEMVMVLKPSERINLRFTSLIW